MSTPLYLIKRTLLNSTGELRQMLAAHPPRTIYANGQQVGIGHTIRAIYSEQSQKITTGVRSGNITITLPTGQTLESIAAQEHLRAAIKRALRREAEDYLPRRLRELAEMHGFSYQKTRLSHASGRWGSCSSHGTISLNIALMKLSSELIDYVLVHELCHTREMNHSRAFWDLVSRYDSNYATHRKQVKDQAPSI